MVKLEFLSKLPFLTWIKQSAHSLFGALVHIHFTPSEGPKNFVNWFSFYKLDHGNWTIKWDLGKKPSSMIRLYGLYWPSIALNMLLGDDFYSRLWKFILANSEKCSWMRWCDLCVCTDRLFIWLLSTIKEPLDCSEVASRWRFLFRPRTFTITNPQNAHNMIWFLIVKTDCLLTLDLVTHLIA